MIRTNRVQRAGVGIGLTTALLMASSVIPANAADTAEDDVVVTNTETVQSYGDATGEIDTSRIYEQIILTGEGTAEIVNPVSTDGLRNLDGFSDVEVEDGAQVATVEVDGEQHLRSVSSFDGDLPLDISVVYLVDGEEVEPGDLVGESGELEVQFTVKNVTSEPQEVTFDDGAGGTVTKTVDVPIPYVGSLTTETPPQFTDVESEAANMAGDGQGGHKLSFTMTLFPPIGSDTATFGYTAHMEDGLVPRVEVSALPVNPLNSPTFKTAATSYQGGAESGAELAAGAAEIDMNLLRIRDGAGELLSGLIQLSDGSDQLAEGLAGEAAPGAQKLSDGLGELDSGVGELNSGANKLADGQRKLEAGLTKLYDGVDNLPASVKQSLAKNEDYLSLLGALTSIADGIGTRGDTRFENPKTLLQGINAIAAGMKYPSDVTGQLTDCDIAATGGDPVRCGVVDALGLMGALLTGAGSQLNPLKADLDALWGTFTCSGPLDENVIPGNYAGDCQHVAKVYSQLYKRNTSNSVLGGSQQKFEDAAAALQRVSAKINSDLLAPGAGLDAIREGLSNPQAGDCARAANTATTADDCGIREAALYLRNVGIPALVDGITTNIRSELLAGLGAPTPGCDPTKTLRCAADALADGGGQLTDGIDRLVAGVVLLNDGGGRLADGLGAAADGSLLLADGLSQAEAGAPRLVDGAQRLSDEGTKKLVEAGEDTTQTYGELYATMSAGAERADQESMAYGAPEDATGLMAYSYILEGDDGQSSRNMGRGLAALALLGAAGAAVLIRRRGVL